MIIILLFCSERLCSERLPEAELAAPMGSPSSWANPGALVASAASAPPPPPVDNDIVGGFMGPPV